LERREKASYSVELEHTITAAEEDGLDMDKARRVRSLLGVVVGLVGGATGVVLVVAGGLLNKRLVLALGLAVCAGVIPGAVLLAYGSSGLIAVVYWIVFTAALLLTPVRGGTRSADMVRELGTQVARENANGSVAGEAVVLARPHTRDVAGRFYETYFAGVPGGEIWEEVYGFVNDYVTQLGENLTDPRFLADATAKGLVGGVGGAAFAALGDAVGQRKRQATEEHVRQRWGHAEEEAGIMEDFYRSNEPTGFASPLIRYWRAPAPMNAHQIAINVSIPIQRVVVLLDLAEDAGGFSQDDSGYYKLLSPSQLLSGQSLYD
jgi:hypothetical protein